MSELRVEFRVPFEEPIVFEAPPSRDKPIQISLDEGAITATLFVDTVDDYVTTHVGGVVLVNDDAVPCKVVRLALALQASDDVAAAIIAAEPSLATVQWGHQLMAAYRRVMTAVVDFARNVKGQFWLHSPIHANTGESTGESLDEMLTQLDAELIVDSYRRKLRLTPGIVKTLTISRRGNPLTPGDEPRLIEFVKRRKPSAAWQEFIANALRERASNNHRAAVIEAVTALESFLKHVYPRVVLSKLGDVDVSQRDLDNLFEKAGLRATANVFFKLTLSSGGWPAERLATLLDAIVLRNELIHNSTRRPNSARAHDAVSAVYHAIADLTRELGA
jgi:hypothetical protein